MMPAGIKSCIVRVNILKPAEGHVNPALGLFLCKRLYPQVMFLCFNITHTHLEQGNACTVMHLE